jgi:FkbM family methyltransferase
MGLLRKMLIRLHLEFLLRFYRLLRARVRTMYLRLRLRLDLEIEKEIRYDFETIDVMRRVLKKNSNCIDVGCHQGVILKEMLRLAPVGVHYAFEPLPEMHRELETRFPGVKLFQIALSDTKGETAFYEVVGSRAHSGLRNRNLEQTRAVHEIKVPTDRLDNLVPGDMPIHFIKIDVEGAEWLVLKGAVNTVRKNKPVIVFEHGLGGANYYDTLPQNLYDLLVKQCGLHISLMRDWLNHKPPMGREEFVAQFEQHLNYYFMAHP